jgi:cysteine synthase B
MDALMPAATTFRESPMEAMVGNTPLLDVTGTLGHGGVRVLAKAEWYNPGGSVKDRPALAIVRDAIDAGLLTPSRTLLDATSGNTGIAYAWLGAAKGFRVKLCISAGASPERKRILAAFGAELEFTDPQEASDGAIVRARHLVEKEPGRYFYADQYGNPSNVRAHATTTGPEIWRQTHGTVTHFVAGLGTTGTLVGTGHYLKSRSAAVRVVGVEPDAPLHGIEGLKHLETAMVPPIFDPAAADERVRVSTEDAYGWCRRLAREAGLLVGVSSGAAAAACQKLAADLDTGTIVTLFPDAGDKYLSEGFWAARP